MVNKEDALYIKACVIAANEEDSQGDTLSTEEIKRLFTNFNNQRERFEIYHQGEVVDGVNLLENYINTAPESISDRMAPVGSWLIIMKVLNPTIKEMVLSHEFEGVSLSSSIKASCGITLPDVTTYADIKNKECIQPELISLVGRLGTPEGPANGYPLEVMDYAAYIQKSNQTKSEIIDKTSLNDNGGSKLKFEDFIQSLKDLINSAESEAESNEEDKPADVPVEGEPAADATAAAASVQKDNVQKAEDVQKAEEAPAEEETEEEAVVDEVAAAIEALTARIDAQDEKIAELQETITELQAANAATDEGESGTAKDTGVDEPTDEVKPKINKQSCSKKTVITEAVEPAPVKTFNERTGRDSFGRKINKF